jgi:hypothetical protein
MQTILLTSCFYDFTVALTKRKRNKFEYTRSFWKQACVKEEVLGEMETPTSVWLARNESQVSCLCMHFEHNTQVFPYL